MKTFLIAVLALVFASTAQAASINGKCGQSMSVVEFTTMNIDGFAARGQKIEFVHMTGSSLARFVAALEKDLASKGYPPGTFDNDWDLVVWAAFKGPNNEEMVGIAAFKDGCLKEADVWDEKTFFKHMKEAFGVDA